VFLALRGGADAWAALEAALEAAAAAGDGAAAAAAMAEEALAADDGDGDDGGGYDDAYETASKGMEELAALGFG
jgi:hypothetical protein